MNRQLLLLFMCVSAISYSCQTQQVPKDDLPKLKLSNDTIRIGQVRQGDSVHATVELRNEGKKTLIIRKLGFSCGCTAAQLTRSVLQTRERATLVITYLNEGDFNEISKTIVIENNSPEPFKVLHLSGTGIPR